MIVLIRAGTISGKIAKEVFADMLATREAPGVIVERKGLLQVSDASVIDQTIDRVLAAHASQVEGYLRGNEKVFGFFVGETMKLMKGKGNPKIVNEILRRKLEALRR